MSQLSENELITAARRMATCGLNKGTAGNLSRRAGEDGRPGFLTTPTGMAYEDLVADDIPFVDLDGQASGRRKPSSEWRLHLDLYRARPEFGAVVHAHSPFATSLACQRAEIPPFHYMIARFGGDTVRCAPYALFGTQALSDAAVDAMTDRRGCLLANHGMLVAGGTLREALDLAIEFETLCEQYWRTLQLGAPVLLSAEEMAAVKRSFSSYGKQE